MQMCRAPNSLQHSTTLNFAQPYGTPNVNRPRADDFGSGSIKDEVIKIFRQTLGIKVDADHIKNYTLMNTSMLHIHEVLKFLNLLNSLAMIVELHWTYR